MSDNPEKATRDRRTEARAGARVAVKFQAVAEAAKALKAFSVNLSTGGLCLRTRNPHQVGDHLALEIDVGGERFNLSGEVAWARDGVIGIRFVGVSTDDRARLLAAVVTK